MKRLFTLVFALVACGSQAIASPVYTDDKDTTLEILNAYYKCPQEFEDFFTSSTKIDKVESKTHKVYPGSVTTYTLYSDEAVLTVTNTYVARQYPPYDQPGYILTSCHLD